MSKNIPSYKAIEKFLRSIHACLSCMDLYVVAIEDGRKKKITFESESSMAQKLVNFGKKGVPISLQSDGCIIKFSQVTNSLRTDAFQGLLPQPTFLVEGGGEVSTYYVVRKHGSMEKDTLEKELKSSFSGFSKITRCVNFFELCLADPPRSKSTTIEVARKSYTFCELYYLLGLQTWFKPIKIENLANQDIALGKDHMPSLLYQFCYRHANLIPCPIDYLFTPLIVVLGSLIGHKLHIQPDRSLPMVVTPILWGIYIGSSGSGKTPAFEVVMGLLQVLIDNEEQRYIEQHLAQSSTAELREIDKQLILEQVKRDLRLARASGDSGELSRAKLVAEKNLSELREEGVTAVKKRYKTSNVTLPSLLKLLVDNPNGLLIADDELKGLLTKLGTKSNEELRAFLLECARGFGSYDSDRITSGQQALTNMAISIVGGIQPDSFNPYLTKVLEHSSDNDGWLHRFSLLSAPNAVEEINSDVPKPSAKVELAMQKLISGIDSGYFGFSPDSSVKNRCIGFSKKAQPIYERWLSEQRAERLDRSALVKSHLRKYEAALPALALIYEIVLSLDKEQLIIQPPKEVRVKALNYAIQTLSYFESHAERTFERRESLVMDNARHLIKMLPSLGRDNFTSSEISQLGWAGMNRNTDRVTRALTVLEEHFYVRRVKKMKGKNGRPSVLWEISPFLCN